MYVKKGDDQFINPGTGSNIPHDFDCAVRQYAWEYGQQIQPRHGNFIQLFPLHCFVLRSGC